jgi:putative sigma-54 modulation protein
VPPTTTPLSPAPPAGDGEGVISVQIKISTRHGHLSDGTQEFIEDKANKLLHYFQRIMMIEVTVDLREDENGDKSVEFLVSAEHKHDFVARAKHKDVLAAVELVLDKLEQQVRKYKEKIQNHRRRAPAGEAPESPTEEPGE